MSDQDTVEIVRRRLADGRTIADSDVRRLVSEVDRLRAALSIAKTVCGQNNCNCPGAKKVKEAVRDV